MTDEEREDEKKNMLRNATVAGVNMIAMCQANGVSSDEIVIGLRMAAAMMLQACPPKHRNKLASLAEHAEADADEIWKGFGVEMVTIRFNED